MRLLTRITLPVLIALPLILTAHSALGASAEPYPGSKLTMEISLTDKDFLPVLNQLLTIIPSALPAEVKSSVPIKMDEMAQDLAGALAGLTSISVAAYDLKAVEKEKLAMHYAPKVGLSKSWQPITAFSEVSLYIKPDPKNMFVLVTHPGGYFTITTTGTIDFMRLMKVVAQLMPVMAPLGQSSAPQAEVETATVVKGTPYGSEGSNTGIGISWEVHGSADVTVQEPDGKGGWRDSGQIATSPKDAPDVPKLTVKSEARKLAVEGYGNYEVRDSEGKAVMRFIVKSRDPKAPALDAQVRIISFQSR